MGDVQLRSFFLGGFECSTHIQRGGKRLDLLEATRHTQFIEDDYRRLQQQGISSVRSGIRWHLIETAPYHYDFSSVVPMIQAARRSRMQVIWDVCHYGWPDDLDIFGPEFVSRFAAFAQAFARLLRSESDDALLLTPINEISFFAWAGAEVGYMNPFARGRGGELKVQLVRASIAGMEAIWDVAPAAHFIHVEPLIRVIAHPNRPRQRGAARAWHEAQYEAWDMLMGRVRPELGGAEKYVGHMGLNYYPANQWIYHGRKLKWTDPLYRPMRELLARVYARYGRPQLISETGAEGALRPRWFRYVSDEVFAAREAGVPIDGICLYPIFNHPGWDDDRHCPNGLWGYCDDQGERDIYPPLAKELQRQRARFEESVPALSPAGRGAI